MSFHYLPLVVISFVCSYIPDFNCILANKKNKSSQSIYILFRVISNKKKSKYVYSRLLCTVIVLCDVAYFCFPCFFKICTHENHLHFVHAIYGGFFFTSFLYLKSYLKKLTNNKQCFVFVFRSIAYSLLILPLFLFVFFSVLFSLLFFFFSLLHVEFYEYILVIVSAAESFILIWFIQRK